MTTFAVDLASLGVTFLFLIISFIAGLAVAVAGAVIGSAGEFFVGAIEVFAGGRPTPSKPKGSALAVFIRAVLYVMAGFGALFLAGTGYTVIGNLLAIAAAFSLGIAVVRFFSRL